MSKTKVNVASVIHHNGPIALPRHMTDQQAIEVLTRKIQYDNQDIAISETIDCFVWDGAIALNRAIEEQFGISMQVGTPSFFGTDPPTMISVDTGPETTVKVPWGAFKLPGITGTLITDTANKEGRMIFRITGQIKRGDEPIVTRLVDRVRQIVRETSIYRSKAFSIRFLSDNGKLLLIPTIKFLRLSNNRAVFTRGLEDAIDTNILTPIRHSVPVRSANIPLKRGILLAGVYGTGKTLLADIVAREATAHGWTYIYATVAELPRALQFAADFQPAIVFAEDIEQIAKTERDATVDGLLLALDGVGNKSAEIMTILTSNHPENINSAMRRPGRIDVVLEIAPPNAEAVERLIRLYTSNILDPDVNLTHPAELLEGQIPAVIRECCERAKLNAISRTDGSPDWKLTSADITAAGSTLLNEQKLFRRHSDNVDPIEKLGRGIGGRLGEHLAKEMTASLNGA